MSRDFFPEDPAPTNPEPTPNPNPESDATEITVEMMLPPKGGDPEHPYEIVMLACWYLCSVAYSYDRTTPHPNEMYNKALQSVFTPDELSIAALQSGPRRTSPDELAAIIAACAKTAIDAIRSMRCRITLKP